MEFNRTNPRSMLYTQIHIHIAELCARDASKYKEVKYEARNCDDRVTMSYSGRRTKGKPTVNNAALRFSQYSALSWKRLIFLHSFFSHCGNMQVHNIYGHSIYGLVRLVTRSRASRVWFYFAHQEHKLILCSYSYSIRSKRYF